jgi:hypothetical protein
MPRPLAIASGCVLALALVALAGWIASHRGDAPAPDDRDLHLSRAPAAESENGYDQFEAAARAARLPKDEPTWRRFHAFHAGETWEPQWISDLVAQNAEATALLRGGLSAHGFAFPPPDGADAHDDRMATLFRLQQLIALAGSQARMLLRDGRAHDAIELDSLGLHAGKRVSAAENVDLFSIYMASAFQTVSLFDLEAAVRTTRFAPDSARALGELLESTRWHSEDWQRVWALEYERLLREVAAAGAHAGDWNVSGLPMFLLPSAYRWHPHRTATALADVYRDQLRKSGEFCADANLERGGIAPLQPPIGLASLLAPNAFGRIVIAEVRSRNLDRIQLKRCQFETHVSLVEALIAAKAYADAEGALPEQLADLVPRYLDAVPLDRYDGRPLRYARAVPAVYSVGEDFTDAGGGAARSPDDPHEPGLSLAF